MSIHPFPESPWVARAKQNLRAALYCIARHPCLPYPAVSRIYYATFQATMARLLAAGFAPNAHHAEVWRAAERLRWGLGKDLWRLYTWRRRADYASNPVDVERARQLVSDHANICRSLGIEEA